MMTKKTIDSGKKDTFLKWANIKKEFRQMLRLGPDLSQ